MPPAEYHATLGPSAAKRWINCPASVSLGAGVEKTTSKYHCYYGRGNGHL